MSTASTRHPDPDAVRAYAVGRLAEGERAAIEGHLATCNECGQLLESAPADPFVRLVAEAAPTSPVGTPLTRIEDPTAPPSPAPSRPPVSAVLDGHPRYRVLSQLGAGGMGVVYLAEHRLMKRRVALKVVLNASLNDPEAAARFHREVEVAARMSHPNIVTAHDAEQFNGTTFLVMEYVPGTNLSALVAQTGRLPVGTAVEYIRQAAVGLQHAHEHGLIHRDLKPSNLMLTPKGEVKVLDFGLVRMSDKPSGVGCGLDTPTKTGIVMGTPDYMAPEQAADSSRVDTRADVYALGCTLYFLLVGREPYPLPSTLDKLIAHKVTPLPDPSKERPDVPPPVVAVLRKMTAKKPDDRYQTPAEVVAALSALVAAGHADPPTEPLPPLGPPRVRPDESPTAARKKSRTQTGVTKKRKKPPAPRRRWGRIGLGVGLAFAFFLWTWWPPIWEIIPPPPWGHQWMIEQGKIKDNRPNRDPDPPEERKGPFDGKLPPKPKGLPPKE